MKERRPRQPSGPLSACDARAWRGLSARGFPVRERLLRWQRRQNQIRQSRLQTGGDGS